MLGTGIENNLIYTVLQEGAAEAFLFRDLSFNQLIEDLIKIPDYKRLNHSQGYIYSFLLSRLFHIWLLLEYHPDSNPQQIIFDQLNGYSIVINEIYEFIKMNCLKIRGSSLIDFCNRLIENINKKTNKKTGFLLDECNVLYNILPESFYSWKGTKIGILTIIVDCLNNIKFDFYMYAGTKIGFDEIGIIIIILFYIIGIIFLYNYNFILYYRYYFFI
jgi:hypothetical protein